MHILRPSRPLEEVHRANRIEGPVGEGKAIRVRRDVCRTPADVMKAADFQRICGEIETDDGVSLIGEIVGREAASTANVKNAHCASGETRTEFLSDPRIAQP
jgi:hypothetical protein